MNRAQAVDLVHSLAEAIRAGGELGSALTDGINAVVKAAKQLHRDPTDARGWAVTELSAALGIEFSRKAGQRAAKAVREYERYSGKEPGAEVWLLAGVNRVYGRFSTAATRTRRQRDPVNDLAAAIMKGADEGIFAKAWAIALSGNAGLADMV